MLSIDDMDKLSIQMMDIDYRDLDNDNLGIFTEEEI